MNKKALAVAISSALAAPMAAQAMSFNAYGVASDILFGENTVSASNFGFSGSEDIGNGVTAGFKLEYGSNQNAGFYVTIKQTADRQTPIVGRGTFLRHADTWWSGNWGKLSLGMGPTASDGMSDADLSGAWLADFSTPSSYGGSVAHRTSGGAAGPRVFSANTYFDGNRRARIRYDAPSFGPLTVSVSAANNNMWAVKGYVYTSLGGGDLSMALGYEADDQRGAAGAQAGRDSIGFSASYLFSQGTNITFNWAERDFEAAGVNDATHWYIKLGHRWGIVGATTPFRSAIAKLTICSPTAEKVKASALPSCTRYQSPRWSLVLVTTTSASMIR